MVASEEDLALASGHAKRKVTVSLEFEAFEALKFKQIQMIELFCAA